MDADTGASAVIEKKAGSDTEFTLKSRHEWAGSLEGSKLTFKRKPKPEEMSGSAPDWARKQVDGKVEWSLELDGKMRVWDCNGAQQELLLQGKWFPGEIKFTEETDAGGKITRQEASVIGKGTPIDIKYRAPGVDIQLLAQTVAGPVHVSYFFYGVPTVVEAIFDQPMPNPTVPVVLTVNGSDVKLTAKRDATDYRRFATDVVLPAAPPNPGAGKPP